jgi:hypothetical protein
VENRLAFVTGAKVIKPTPSALKSPKKVKLPKCYTAPPLFFLKFIDGANFTFDVISDDSLVSILKSNKCFICRKGLVNADDKNMYKTCFSLRCDSLCSDEEFIKKNYSLIASKIQCIHLFYMDGKNFFLVSGIKSIYPDTELIRFPPNIKKPVCYSPPSSVSILSFLDVSNIVYQEIGVLSNFNHNLCNMCGKKLNFIDSSKKYLSCVDIKKEDYIDENQFINSNFDSISNIVKRYQCHFFYLNETTGKVYLLFNVILKKPNNDLLKNPSSFPPYI